MLILTPFVGTFQQFGSVVIREAMLENDDRQRHSLVVIMHSRPAYRM